MERQARTEEHCQGGRHPESAERYQPVLDLPARCVAGDDAAERDAERHRAEQEPAPFGSDAQDSRAVGERVDADDRPEEPESSAAGKREEQDAVLARPAELLDRVGHEVQADLDSGLGGADAGDAETRDDPEERERDQ